jgi:hypothetical protein
MREFWHGTGIRMASSRARAPGDYAVWSAFDNHYRPALYFADVQGRIRHHQFGEGKYQQSEMVIPATAGRDGNDRP